MRQKHGEARPLVEVPGCLFGPDESSDAIDFATLVLARGWTAYLYLASKAATFLLWEGALIDFWSNHRKVEKSVVAELCRYNLRVVHRYKG